ncbi:helix-turn-helix transcriptional regulator [Arthrobacter tecti]
MPSAGSRERAQRAAVGEKVRELRLAQGLSQERLAHEAGLDRSYIGGVERGERNVALDNIYRLARALAVAPGELLPTVAAIRRRSSE